MKHHPVVTAYKSLKDLVQLKSWFYDFDEKHDYRENAVQKVQLFMTRGRLPHGVEATSILTSTVINDENATTLGLADSNVLQLSYTMAIIRFVNGLLDPLQQSQFAVPMQLLAKQLQLPTSFVELRHMGTHENMPSLEMLRIGCKNALNWLYDHYWCHVDGAELAREVVVDELKDVHHAVVAFRISRCEQLLQKFNVMDNLKLYRRVRKVHDLDAPLLLEDGMNRNNNNNNNNNKGNSKNVNNKANMGDFLKYEQCLHDLQEFNRADSELFVEVLIRKFIIIYPKDKLKTKQIKYNPLLEKLYRPLFQFLGLEFNANLLSKICLHILQNNKKNTPSDAKGEQKEGEIKKEISDIDKRVFKKLGLATTIVEEEATQLAEWIPGLISSILSYSCQSLPLTVEGKPGSISSIRTKNEVVNFLLENLKSLPLSCLILCQKSIAILSQLVNEENSGYEEAVVKKVNDFQISIASQEESIPTTAELITLPPSLDELLSDNMLLVGKRKAEESDAHNDDNSSHTEEIPSSRKRQKGLSERKMYLLEPYEDWKPTPFGICP